MDFDMDRINRNLRATSTDGIAEPVRRIAFLKGTDSPNKEHFIHGMCSVSYSYAGRVRIVINHVFHERYK